VGFAGRAHFHTQFPDQINLPFLLLGPCFPSFALPHFRIFFDLRYLLIRVFSGLAIVNPFILSLSLNSFFPV